MIGYYLKQFEKSTKGTYIENSKPICFKYILTDSRLVLNPSESVFFAISGKNHDGHRFIKELYNRGVKNFVIENNSIFKIEDIKKIFSKANFILVENAVIALQEFVIQKRNSFNFPIIGVTGSNGKTIIKEWLFQLLHKKKRVIRNPKSYNSQIGVPLSVWLLEKDAELGIFEAGISKPGEMEKLKDIINPTIGIFINISDAHQENFTSYDQKIDEKLKLFTNSEAIIYCRDNKLVREKIENGRLKNKKLISWSKNSNADLKITKILEQQNYTKISGIYKGEKTEIEIPFTDKASIENCIFCLLYLLFAGYDNKKINNSFKELTPVAMRLELKHGNNNCIIINDYYNSDLASLNIALDFLKNQNKHKKKTIILSDILQSNKDESELYKNVANIVNNKDIYRFIGIGKSISKYKELFKKEKLFFDTTDSFNKSVLNINFRDEIILLKGARDFQFEKISNLLQKKVHETVLEIDLEAITSNFNYFRSFLDKKTKIMVMVKAFSYGSGSYEIANLLQFHGADYLAVAYTDEGIELRKAGINLPIMVMNPKIENYNLLIDFNLEPEIYNFRTLELITKTLLKKGIKNYPVHIKLDTGMRRLGFIKNEIKTLTKELKNNDAIKIKSIFSHLAASEDKKSDKFTLKQIDEFKEHSKIMITSLNYPVLRHILNSAGIERFSEFQFDMVRLGIGLYGFSFIKGRELESVSKLKSTISQIKEIKQGDTIGYNRKGELKAGSKIAIVPVGYADGLNRGLGNGIGSLYIKGKAVPIVGNISMDMCTIDVSGLHVNEGDEVSVFENNNHINKIAKYLKTIPYEIKTNISQRVKRVYYQ